MTDPHLTRPPIGAGLWSLIAGRSVRGRAELLLALLDAMLAAAAYALLLLGRHDIAVPADAWEGFRAFVPIAVGVHLAANWMAGLYGPVWRHASMREAQQVVVAGVGATVGLTGLLLVLPRFVPLSVAGLGGVFAMFLFGFVRFQSRLFAFRRGSHRPETRVVVVGAGRVAAAIARELDEGNDSRLEVVAYVDDDLAKVGRRIGGRTVSGTIDDLDRVVREHDADEVLLAITDPDPALVQRVVDVASALALPMKVLSGVDQLVSGTPRVRDIRDLSIDDVLGRQQVETDLDAVRRLLAGKRVLVTGGGGSIGSEIVRQVHQFGPAALAILDIDETHIHDAAANVDGRCEQLLVDVTRRGQVDQAFADFEPEVVFHAAAKKHVPLLESHPCIAIDTNVFGTDNVVAAADAHGVEHLVFVSTDKAVLPANVMGASKRIGEQLVLAGRPTGAAWCGVRFGNVLGSRGSVVPTFMRQISEGGPLTVTDRAMTRFFMSIPEAVQLVLQSAALARGGEIFMLDMGEPVRIVDLATRMVTLAGKRPDVDIAIDVVGLRPGEKLTEELHVPAESPTPTDHPKVTRLTPPILAHDAIGAALSSFRAAVARGDDLEARHLLFGLASSDDVRRPVDDDVLVIIDAPESATSS